MLYTQKENGSEEREREEKEEKRRKEKRRGTVTLGARFDFTLKELHKVLEAVLLELRLDA